MNIASVLGKFSGKNKSYEDNRAYYILYKIVDQILYNHLFLLQCINTKAIFQSNRRGAGLAAFNTTGFFNSR